MLKKCPRCKQYSISCVCRCGEKTKDAHPTGIHLLKYLRKKTFK